MLIMRWWLEEIESSEQINEELEVLMKNQVYPSSTIQVQPDGEGRLVKFMVEGECLGYALIALNEQFPYDEIFSHLLMNQFDSIEQLDEEYLPRFRNGCTIIWMDSLVRGLGVGRGLVEAIKERYESVLLYSLEEAMGFWEKQDFQAYQETPLYGFESY